MLTASHIKLPKFIRSAIVWLSLKLNFNWIGLVYYFPNLLNDIWLFKFAICKAYSLPQKKSANKMSDDVHSLPSFPFNEFMHCLRNLKWQGQGHAHRHWQMPPNSAAMAGHLHKPNINATISTRSTP